MWSNPVHTRLFSPGYLFEIEIAFSMNLTSAVIYLKSSVRVQFLLWRQQFSNMWTHARFFFAFQWIYFNRVPNFIYDILARKFSSFYFIHQKRESLWVNIEAIFTLESDYLHISWSLLCPLRTPNSLLKECTCIFCS